MPRPPFSATLRGGAPPDLTAGDMRSDWLRLRTLILLRWLAISGQVTAILVADFVFGMQLDLLACIAVVSASVITNIALMVGFPANRRLSEYEAMATFILDTVQIVALLALTGGLSNPFALLVLAPVTIAATSLQMRATSIVGIVTIVLLTLVAFFNTPLLMADGRVLSAPPLFEFGFWLGIVVGVAFLGLYARRVTTEVHLMADALAATQMALAREQKLTDLGGVIAATAHELGTPLATIMLTSTELSRELDGRPDLKEDALLIRAQAERCRDILRSMGRSGKDDPQTRTAPLSAVLREAAEPHLSRGKHVAFSIPDVDPDGRRQPVVRRLPELIHGLRNLIQNAVDFATSRVWIDAAWTETDIEVRISDDGPGFPAGLITRIGDPYVRGRTTSAGRAVRPGYDGMGLGLFIAKTLLERTGATLEFTNGGSGGAGPNIPVRKGAIVEATWKAASITAEGIPGTSPMEKRTAVSAR